MATSRGLTMRTQQAQLHSSNQRRCLPTTHHPAQPVTDTATASPAAAAGHVHADARAWPGSKPLGPSQQAKRASGELNYRIRHARQLQELELLLATHRNAMDAVHVSALCSQLVKAPAVIQQLATRSPRELHAFIATLSATILDQAPAMAPRQSSSLLWALGKLALQPIKPSTTSTMEVPLKQLLQHPQTRSHELQGKPTTSPAASWDQPLFDPSSGTGTDHFSAAASALLTRLAATAPLASGQDVALALYGAAQQLQQPSGQQLARLLERMQLVLPACSSQDLSMSIYALALLNRAPNPAWTAAFLPAAQRKLLTCSCQALSNIIWALATLQQRPDPAWLTAFCQASGQSMAMFSNQELSVTVWALSKMSVHPGRHWMSMLEAEATERAPTMNDQDLDLVLSAMAQLGHKPSQPLLSELSTQLMARSSRGTYAPPSSAPGGGTRHGVGVNHRGDDGPVAAGRVDAGAALGRASGLPRDGGFPAASAWGRRPGHAEGVGSGSGRVSASPPQPALERAPSSRPVGTAGVQSPAGVVLRGSKGLGPAGGRLEARAACDILTSLVRLHVVPSQAVLDSLLTGLTPSLAHMKAGDLVAVLQALARLHHRPRGRWLARLLRLLRLRLPGMGPAQLAGMLWSLARLGVRPEDRWISWVLLECQRKLPESRPQELASMVWALARLGYQPRNQWLASFFHHTALKLHGFKLQEIAMMADAVARSRFEPPQRWVAKVNSELARRVKAGVNKGVKSGSDGNFSGREQLELKVEGDAEHAAALVCHKEVYAVLRALARMDGGAHGCLPARASSVPCEGALLMAANMASLRLIKGKGAG